MSASATLRVIVVDDEPLARERIRRLASGERDVQIVAECANGREAVEAIVAHAPDVVLLDVQMPELDGFGVIAALPSDVTPLVIFVTAFDEHALRAFDVHAVDYVLKPIDPDRLHEALARAREAHEGREAVEQHKRTRAMVRAAGERDGAPAPIDRFLVKTDGRMFFVNAADVDWVEAEGNYVRLHAGGATHLIRETIAAVEKSLPASRFARIHRSAIVNLDRVVEMRQWNSGDYIVILQTGARLKLSRTYRQNLEARAR